MIFEHAGLQMESYREAPIWRRTSACLRVLRTESEPVALARVAADPPLIDRALNALLIGVTEFFRDVVVFQAIQTHVIPLLAGTPGPLRIASVGCSSGAELYSVAMLLAEAGVLDRAHLLGVDCRPEAVASATAGIFPDAAVAPVDARLRSRYFEPASGGWRVVDDLQRRAEWRVLDATRVCPPGPWNLVLCRNVLIYLRNHAGEAMLERIVHCLAPGGFIVLGKAERPAANLKLTEVGRCVYRTDRA